jgi:hypothetical protein
MSATSPPAPRKGHCPQCGPDRFADVVGYHRAHDEDDRSGVWVATDYRIMRCRGCEAVYFQTDEVFSEDVDSGEDPNTGEYVDYTPHKITHWPAPSKRAQPDWASKLHVLDPDLAALFDDIYVALDNDLRVLAAIGIRTAFDRASELLGVDSGQGFAQKLKELVQLGKIGADERDTLDVLTNAGSAAAHRGWRPEPQELDTMMSIIEAFLYRTFILDRAAKSLKQSVPVRPRRQ